MQALNNHVNWVSTQGVEGVRLKWVAKDFTDLDLSEYGSLRYATFIGCNLSGLNAEGLDLRYATFISCDMSDANLNRCDLRGVTFTACNIETMSYDYARVEGLVIR